MKKNFLLFVLIAVGMMMACKSNNKANNNDSTGNGGLSAKSIALMQTYKPFLQGVWVKSDYIAKVLKTKSPLAAEDLAEGITTMVINADSLKGDSILVEVGWGNHEGGEEMLKFRPGKKPHTILLGPFDLGLNVSAKDTSLILYFFDNDRKAHSIVKYRKALPKRKSDLGDGLDYLINKGLIAGKYTVIDSAGAKSEAVFTVEGAVSGLEGFKKYEISDDLSAEPMNNLDEIIFDLADKKSKDYTFKFDADTLKLFTTKANADSTVSLVDKLVYKLVRNK